MSSTDAIDPEDKLGNRGVLYVLGSLWLNERVFFAPSKQNCMMWCEMTMGFRIAW